ncbi:DUF1835 domain-containing protein [Paenibacillus thermoaerophilus]|uniref:DUF1835 domain-containing protein n=1 Tax=Paenibacillus thermoaerophilus TaxID=1215385 RepID=UPI0014768C7B|nr:DUF1835 domain-containing protein [Paenibacillus thermoaerophilus]TMV17078.1 DUF1835 domain-containing protein [Paenibacillus thermoaerophilus]
MTEVQREADPADSCEAAYQELHVVFSPSTAGALKRALQGSGSNRKAAVVTFDDIFSVGPLTRLHEESDRKNRREWLSDHLNPGHDDDLEEYGVDFEQAVREIQDRNDAIPITIWYGDNAHEQAGLRFVLFLLRNSRNPVKLIDATKRTEQTFNTRNTRIDDRHTGEISPKKWALRLNEASSLRTCSPEEKRRLADEWLHLSEQPSLLRGWKDSRFLHMEEDAFDSDIIDALRDLQRRKGHDEYIHAARVIGEVLGRLDQYVGDGYLEYRLRTLIYKGVLEIKGVPRAMRYYRVRLKNAR